jgi:hypothetical protein
MGSHGEVAGSSPGEIEKNIFSSKCSVFDGEFIPDA